MGGNNDLKTAGGGYIFLNIDKLILKGEGEKMTANGYPKWDSEYDQTLHGGSGGYIFIRSHNVYGDNELSSKAMIQARGGQGKKDGYSGAGGTIYFAGNFT
jgi:hypothetical protein